MLLLLFATVSMDARQTSGRLTALRVFLNDTIDLCTKAVTADETDDVQALTGHCEKWANYLREGISIRDEYEQNWKSARDQVKHYRQEMLKSVGTQNYDSAAQQLKMAEVRATNTRRTYLRRLAVDTGIARAMNHCKACLDMAEAEPQTTLDPTGAAGPGSTSERPGECATAAGPLRCTGQFDGEYRNDCVISKLNDRGSAKLVLSAEGGLEIRYTSSINPANAPLPLHGTVESSGRVFIEEKGANKIEHWEGQLRVEAGADGARRLLGSGTYTHLSVQTDGTTTIDCQGTLRLNAGW
jgi:hypothetical protein